jgi:hypothetical protein
MARSKPAFRSGEGVFLNIPWSNETDLAFEAWRKGEGKRLDTEAILALVMTEELAVKLGTFKGSAYASLESPKRKEEQQTFILSGWADNYREALAIAWFKLKVVCEGDWDFPVEASPTSRRR